MSWDPTVVAAFITLLTALFNIVLPYLGLNLDPTTVNSLATAIVLALLGIQTAKAVKVWRAPASLRSTQGVDHLNIF